MNKILEEQLSKVREADLSHFDPNTNTFDIPRKTSIRLKEDSIYIISLRESVFNNEILKANWNNSVMPSSHYLKADINRVMNNMIKVTCIELDEVTLADTSKMWSGWLPLDSIDVLKEEK